MSYRELRNFTEMMRALGYNRPISVENFRTPNFELVADVLFWLSKKYDPFLSISEEIDTEDDRIDFLTSIATGLLSKARIKLNTKKLYAGDGHAVKELLKIAKVLYSAVQLNENSNVNDIENDDDDISSTKLLNKKLKDTKATRILSTEITDKGAKLYDLLESELEIKNERDKAIRFLDTVSTNLESTSEHRYLEKSIRDIVLSVRENINSTEKQLEDINEDEKSLKKKIEKKKMDLERNEKRLRNLQTVRPAFMDEYEKLEKDLENQYSIYCERFRNLDYLEYELDIHNKKEQEKIKENERSMQRMQKRLRDEELRILRGDQQDIQSNNRKVTNSASKDKKNVNRRGPAEEHSSSDEESDSNNDNESSDDNASSSSDPLSSNNSDNDSDLIDRDEDDNNDNNNNNNNSDSDSDILEEGSDQSSSISQSEDSDNSDNDF